MRILKLLLLAALVLTEAKANFFYRAIVIDHTKVPSTQTNFPVLVTGTLTYLKTVGNGGKVTNANGYDVNFWSDSGLTTPLNWETASYDATTGVVQYWVLIASVSSSVDTTIYMSYGNAAITTDQSHKTATWSPSNFVMVMHLEDNAASTTVADSTTSPVTAVSTQNTSALTAAAQIGQGFTFNGSTDQVLVTDTSKINVSSTGGGDFSISVWFNATSYSSFAAVFDKAPVLGANSRDYSFFINSTSDGFWAAGLANGVSWSQAGFTTAAWHLLHMTRSSGTTTAYLDGASLFTHTFSGTTESNGNLAIGGNPSGGASTWTGDQDEFHINSTALSADWITAEFNNQSSPSTFTTIGTEQTVITATSSPARMFIFQ